MFKLFFRATISIFALWILWKDKVAGELIESQTAAKMAAVEKVTETRTEIVVAENKGIKKTTNLRDQTKSDNFVVQLNELQNARSGRHHLENLDFFFSEQKEWELYDHIRSQIATDYKTAKFSDERETLRMQAIDYIGEKINGRLKTDNKERWEKLAWEILEKPIDKEKFEKRQIKSLLGDRIELMRYITKSGPQPALRWLESQDTRWDFAAIKIGVVDGLWAAGYSMEKLQQMGLVEH